MPAATGIGILIMIAGATLIYAMRPLKLTPGYMARWQTPQERTVDTQGSWVRGRLRFIGYVIVWMGLVVTFSPLFQ